MTQHSCPSTVAVESGAKLAQLDELRALQALGSIALLLGSEPQAVLVKGEGVMKPRILTHCQYGTRRPYHEIPCHLTADFPYSKPKIPDPLVANPLSNPLGAT